MKSKIIGMIVLLSGMGFSSLSQEVDVFADEDLTNYAMVMKWAENEKSNMGKSVSTWVKESEGLSGSKYNELSAAAKNGTLDEAESTDEELAIFNEILQRTENVKALFKETYTTKIKEEIGASVYNKLRKALKGDEELKARYDEIFAALPILEEKSVETQDSGGN